MRDWRALRSAAIVGTLAVAAVRLVGAQEAVVLSCPATVVRGETVRCTLAPAAARPTVVGWHFRPVTGSPLTRAVEATSAEWSGPMVLTGTVEARVRTGAREDTLRARIEVLPRDWRRRRAVERVREVPTSQLPIHPRRMSDLGATTLSATVMVPELERAAAQVQVGPNAGLWYLTGIPVAADALVDINRPALAAGSEFWTRHGAAVVRRAGARTCTRGELSGEITRVVEAHEGLRGRGDAHSHAARFFESLDADLVPRIESYVEAEGDFRGLAQLVTLFAQAAGARSQQMDVDGSNRSVAPCEPRWY